MARKKEPPKPLASLRFDFIESLENVCHQATMMLQVVDTLLQHGDVKPSIKSILEERSKALREAIIGPE